MHFFTEPSKLDVQSSSDVFGPIAGSKYRISSKHKILPGSAAKIFACQDAMMLVIPTIDASKNLVSGKVNLIVKPIGALPIRMQPVKYYIFRGVDSSSYFASGTLIPHNVASNCEFINKLHFNWIASLPLRPTTPPPTMTPKMFGFDDILATDPIYRAYYIEELFNSSASLTVPLRDYSSVKVREGEWIGNIPASGSFEFEIITDTENMPITLEYAEFESYQIDGSSPALNPNAVTLDALTIREKVLNYIDPAAFFGMHFDTGIRIHNGYTSSGNGSNTIASLLKRKQVAYNDIISKFLNKNVVYLDIRSERGYSYGFYQNYRDGSDILKLKSKSNLFFHSLDYSNMEWPLVNLNNPPGNLNALVPGDPIYLKLSTKDNDTPVLFAEDPKLFGTNNKKQFYNQKDIKDLNKKIRLFVPNAMDSSNKVNVAWQIKLQYFREKDHEDSPLSVFKNKNYLDSVFGGMNSQALTIPTKFNHVQNTKRHFVNGGSFSFITDTGFYFEAGTTPTVMLYSELAYSKDKSSSSYPKISLGSVTNEGILRHKNVVYSKTPITVSSVIINVLNIVGYNRTSNETTPKENLHLLGLTKAEWDAILGDVTSLSGHQVYLKFVELDNGSGAPLKDDGGIIYRKFKVVATGLDTSLTVQEDDSFGPMGNIFVYGFNTAILCSKDFAAVQDIAPFLPDPVNMADYPDAHLISYTGKTPEVRHLFSAGALRLTDDNYGSFLTNPWVNLVGDIFFPVDTVGGNTISGKGNPFPLIVISPGNGHHYPEYRVLAKFLSRNGFIVAIISNLAGIGRTLFETYNTSSTFYGCTISPNPFTSDDFLFINIDSRMIFIFNRSTTKISTFIGEFNTTYTIYTWTKKYELNWRNGKEFQTWITPESKSWTKIGSAASTDILGFGIEWINNSGTGSNKKANLKISGIKMVELNASQYAYSKYSDIKSAIDGEVITHEIKIPYPKTTVDEYIGTIFNDVYYMIHVKSSTLSGTTVTLDVEIKNAQIELNLSGGEHGLGILGRANIISAHLQIIKKFMGANVQNNIGLIGHSRGAEAVVRAATDISALSSTFKFDINNPSLRTTPYWKNVPNDLYNISAVASLAPTDVIKNNISGMPYDAVKIVDNIPFYILYGSMEGDVEGFPNPYPVAVEPFTNVILTNTNRNSGFSIYDRSKNNSEKAMSFVYGATHNGFITNNHDYTDRYTGFLSKLMDITKQRDIAKGYFNAFMRMHLKEENHWAPYFYGDVIPLSVKEEGIYPQYRNMFPVPGKWYEELTSTPDANLSGIPIASRIIDPTVLPRLVHSDLVDFSKPALTYSVEYPSGSGIYKNFLLLKSPHDKMGLYIDWTTTQNILTLKVNNLAMDATLFEYLSFRIGHIANIPSSTYQDLSILNVKLKDLSGQVSERIINKQIPSPFEREEWLIKSSMMTVRLPLNSFVGTADLAMIEYVIFEFPGSGTVSMDEFEFTD